MTGEIGGEGEAGFALLDRGAAEAALSPSAESPIWAAKLSTGPEPLMVKARAGRPGTSSILETRPSLGSCEVQVEVELARARCEYAVLKIRSAARGLDALDGDLGMARRHRRLDRRPRWRPPCPARRARRRSSPSAPSSRVSRTATGISASAKRSPPALTPSAGTGWRAMAMALASSRSMSSSACQQSAAAPDEMRVLDRQPDALTIRDGDIGNAHIRRHDAIDPRRG